MFSPAAIAALRARLSDGGDTSDGELGREIERLWQAASARWPGVTVAPDRFCEILAQHAGARAQLPKLRTQDLYLACGCLDGDTAAMRAFDGLVEDVASRLGKLGREAALLADAKQHARQSVMARDGAPAPLAAYNGRGELGGWLRVVMSRELVHQLRREQRHAPLDDARRLESDDNDPEMAYLKKQYEREFKEAFGQAMRELDEDEQRALRYAVVEGMSIDDIARLERVHRATAARSVARARARLAELTRAILQKRLAVDTQQLDSILRLVPSQVDVSVRRLLG
jgi:RNA polymerase sigma-70 factor (ECF subfamily)